MRAAPRAKSTATKPTLIPSLYTNSCILLSNGKSTLRATEHNTAQPSGLWCVFLGSPPPVFHPYPACISPYPWYPAVSLYLAILQQIHCIPLYPTVSVRNLAVSSCRIPPPRKRDITKNTLQERAHRNLRTVLKGGPQ